MLSSKGIYKMVDGTSETVILDHKAERIVAVGPNAADLASELAGDSVVASTAAPYQSSNGVKATGGPLIESYRCIKTGYCNCRGR